MAPTSFGLRSGDEEARIQLKKISLEETFLLMEYCHFSYGQAKALPIELRRWFLQRKQEENKKVEEARKRASKSAPKAPSRKR